MTKTVISSGTSPKALVVGASGGLGEAFVTRLSDRRGPDGVLALSRQMDGLDITDEGSVQRLCERLSGIEFDLIIDATGILEAGGQRPEKSFSELTPEAMREAFAVNAMGPALLMKYLLPRLVRHQRSVFASLSARVGSIGDNRLGGWMSYRASKAALNQFIRCATIETARTHPEAIIVALHPGTIKTPLTERYARGRYTHTPIKAAEQMLDVLEQLKPSDSGRFLDYAGHPIEW